MPRPLQRVRLESGFKLNLNSLARRGFIKPGATTGPVGIAWTDDASQGGAKIKSRLCSVGGFDPDEWELPPKPKWMRWKTYNRMVEKFDRHEATVEEGLAGALMRLGLPLG